MQEHRLQVGETTMEVDITGAWVTSLRDADGDILFARAPLKNDEGDTKLRGGCHVCVPQFGPSGDELDLAQHGFGRDSLWTVQDSTPSTLVLSLAPTHEDYQDLQIILTYKLAQSSLIMELSLHNDRTSEVRVAPAFHPYFATNRAATIGLNDETLSVDDFGDTKFIEGMRNVLEVNGRTVELVCDELPLWALWSDRLGEYFCVEPTLGGNLFLNQQAGEKELIAPNGHASYRFAIFW